MRERATRELRSYGRGNRYNRYIDAVVPTVPDRNRTDQPDKNKIINIGRECRSSTTTPHTGV